MKGFVAIGVIPESEVTPFVLTTYDSDDPPTMKVWKRTHLERIEYIYIYTYVYIYIYTHLSLDHPAKKKVSEYLDRSYWKIQR